MSLILLGSGFDGWLGFIQTFIKANGNVLNQGKNETQLSHPCYLTPLRRSWIFCSLTSRLSPFLLSLTICLSLSRHSLSLSLSLSQIFFL